MNKLIHYYYFVFRLLHSQQSYRLDLNMMPDSGLNQLDDQIDSDNSLIQV